MTEKLIIPLMRGSDGTTRVGKRRAAQTTKHLARPKDPGDKGLPNLTPTEASCVEMLTGLVHLSPVVTLEGPHGTGRTTILRALQRRIGGTFVELAQVVEAMADRHPLALEEAFAACVLRALRVSRTVLVDDFDVIAAYVESHM